jgi:leader peptidase (prepilin peptidase)/N-methyltransferase
VVYFFLISILLVVFLVDSKYGIIPLSAILVGLLITLILFLLQPDFSPIPHLLSAIGAFLFLYILTLVRIKGKTAMGLGDAVYAFFMGFLLGFPGIIVGMYIAFLTGALVASILIVRGKKRLQGSTIPFGPFLVLGTYIALFWSNQIVWYALHFFYR